VALVQGVDVVAVTVSDMNRAREFYCDLLGMTPVEVKGAGSAWSDEEQRRCHAYHEQCVGLPGAEIQALFLQAPDGTHLELIEYQKGKTIHKEFLDEKGEGLHHVKVTVKDFNATLEKFKKRGIPVLQMDQPVGGGGMAYFDTTQIGGLMIEISQRPPGFDPKEGVKYK
jgi:catechol 2,3-dioxygenase-like lactoylglutathione lyase family enzyme